MILDTMPLTCLSSQVASSIRDAGGEAFSVPGDVTAEDFAPKIIKSTIQKYGALHILVNNAGMPTIQHVAFAPCSTSMSACHKSEISQSASFLHYNYKFRTCLIVHIT